MEFAAAEKEKEKEKEERESEKEEEEIISNMMSKSAKKKQMKKERYEVKKAEKKAAEKEHRKKELERKRREWDIKLQSMCEEERSVVIQSRLDVRKQRMEQRSHEKNHKRDRLIHARLHSHNIVIDLDFKHLMSPQQIHSLVQQIMYCYAVNGRCSTPGHLWLTGCQGDMETQLRRLPGFDKWIIEKENCPYIEAFKDRKDDLVYLTADSENLLDDLDLSKIYIVGGLVDRNRWKGLTMKKAQDQGIQTAKLPIGNYLKMCSSQVLTVNQVVEIMLKFLETKDWKSSFFHVIPQRKRCEAGNDEDHNGVTENEVNGDAEKYHNGDVEHFVLHAENEGNDDAEENFVGHAENDDIVDQLDRKRKCLESPPRS